MSCREYEYFDLGQKEEVEFKQHLSECDECRQQVEEDEKLFGLASELNIQVRSPLLWARIENTLRKEKKRKESSQPFLFRKTPILLRLAAALVVAVGLSTYAYFAFKPNLPQGNLLTADALKKVEKVEEDYIRAIAELDEFAQEELTKMDVELMLLYRDRLATIDAQIERCKEALQDNPGNTHIRRYMLAALQDKKATLKEILNNES